MLKQIFLLRQTIYFSCQFAQNALQSSQRMDQASTLYLNELNQVNYDLYVTQSQVIWMLLSGLLQT